jgi:hypothetical protein
MEPRLSIKGLFESEQELLEAVRTRKICYDVEPYYINRKGQLVQIGFQISLYGTFPHEAGDISPDSLEYAEVERDVRRIAEALSKTCDSMHMCESTTIEPGTITYSQERKMRPDVTVHIPVFDQKDFGHPVDDAVRRTMEEAVRLLESAGIAKTYWRDDRP